MDIFFFSTMCSSFFNWIFLALVFVANSYTNISHASLGYLAYCMCPIIVSCTLIDSQCMTFLAPWFQSLYALISAAVTFYSSRFGVVSCSPSMYSQYPLPIRKLAIQNLHAWRLFLSNFSATIWLILSPPDMILQPVVLMVLVFQKISKNSNHNLCTYTTNCVHTL